LALAKKQRECQRPNCQYFFVFFAGAPVFFPVVCVPVVPIMVLIVPMLPIEPAVPVVSVAIIPVPVVFVVLVVVVPVVLVDVRLVSVAAVSVFAFSSFLQPNANMATAITARRASKRDFFIGGLSSFVRSPEAYCGEGNVSVVRS